MFHNNKGQIRIVEAMLTCLIVLAGLSVCVYIAHVYTVMERGSVQEMGTNIVNVLEDSDVMERLISHQDSGESELRGILANLLPPDTYYLLTLRSALTGDTILEINNTAGPHNASDYDLSTTERVVTISLPLKRSSYVPLDVMLIMDVSGSMGEKLPGDVKTKLRGAQEAATVFIDQLNSSRDRVGLVSFSTEATLRQSLTYDFGAVSASIWALAPQYTTNIGGGINCSAIEFRDRGRGEKTIWAMVLLSDGKANVPQWPANATQYALDRARDAYEIGHNQNLRIYTIGLGAKSGPDPIDEVLLKQIAQGPLDGITGLEGQYFYAPSAGDLQDIYLNIAKDLMFKVQYDVVVIELTLIKPR